MKQSGIDWIGEIPDGWEIYQLSQLVKQVKNKNSLLQEKNLLSLSYGSIKRKDINSSDGLLPASFDGYNIIENGDIVLRLTDLQNDHTSLRVGRTSERGIITSAYTTLHPININHSKFLYYMLHSFDLKKGFYGMGAGVRQGLNYDEVKSLKVPLPPLAEQQKIAAYLDKKISQIDAIITEAKQSIEEYKAWKQSVIFEAVTGKNKSGAKKDSGIEWIGEIPEGWEVCKTLYLLNMPITDGPHETPVLYDSGIPFISAEAVSCGNGHIDFSHMRGYISEEYYIECCKKYIPQLDDIYMIKSGATTGKIAKVETAKKFTIWSPLAVFRFNTRKVYIQFMYYYLQSECYQKQIEDKWTFGTQQNIGMRTLEKLKTVLPPIHEQEAIAKMLDSKCAQIDSLIAEKESLIADLSEYKKSLIFEVVTGKRSV